MMKIGIVTLYHNSRNYGGLLQAYSLIKVLERFGVEAYQINYESCNGKKTHLFVKEIYKSQGLVGFIGKIFNKIIKFLYNRLMVTYYKPLFRKRNKELDQFRISIPHTEVCNKLTIETSCMDMDALIVGSDQVWKPTVIDSVYSLNFAGNKPKMAYAVSLSVDKIPETFVEYYKNVIESINFVSVRENSARHLLGSICHTNDIECVCDPTMLLKREDWLSLCQCSNKQDEKYLFCYFLGDTKSHRDIVHNYAKQHNLKIVTYPNLMGFPRMVDTMFGDLKLYDSNPMDFVYLISKAEIVFTDSFHATSFSIYMHTPFFVFSRDAVFSMNSRITSILKKISCEDRFVSPKGHLDAKPIDWVCVDGVLEKERQKGLFFIQRFLNSITT